MVEQLVNTISQEGGIAVSILLLVIVGIVWYVRQVDKRNMELTEFRIQEVKDNNEYFKQQIERNQQAFNNGLEQIRRESNEKNKQFANALASFDRTMQGLTTTNTKLEAINNDLKDVKHDLEVIKYKQEIKVNSDR